MSFGARCGFFVVLVSLAAPAFATDRPAATWQDPPARDAGTPDTVKSVQPETSAKPGPTGARIDGASPQRMAPRSAKAERERTVRVMATEGKFAARRTKARASKSAKRYEPHAFRLSTRHRYQPHVRAAAPFASGHPAFEEARPRYPLAQFRREGWGNLVFRPRSRLEPDIDSVLHPRMIAFPSYSRSDEHIAIFETEYLETEHLSD